jgi:hypothetical protein
MESRQNRKIAFFEHPVFINLRYLVAIKHLFIWPHKNSVLVVFQKSIQRAKRAQKGDYLNPICDTNSD